MINEKVRPILFGDSTLDSRLVLFDLAMSAIHMYKNILWNAIFLINETCVGRLDIDFSLLYKYY